MAVGSSNDFDLVVLGAGTGGDAAAFRASQLGLKVALVDEDKLGGTCLHRGCIPTKALLESAAFNERLRHAADFGLNLGGETTVDYAKVAARRDMVVNRMWKGVQSLVKKYDVTWIQGRGRLDGATKVRVQTAGDDGTPGAGAERILNATDVVLATGSRVKSLAGIVPDGKRIVTSDDVLRMDTMPASVIIIGAGAVGTEFASMYHDLGATVTLLEYLPAIVPLEDRDVSKELERSFNRRGIKVGTNARFDGASVKGSDDGVAITVGPEGKDATELTAEMLLVAAGRAAGVRDGRPEAAAPWRGRGGARDERRGRRARDDGRRAGSWLREGRRPHAHEGAAPLRDRRHRRRPDARAHGCPRGDHGRPHDRGRPRRPRHGLREAAQGHLLPSRDRVRRPDRAGVREAGPLDEDRQGPVPGHRQGAHRRRVRGLHEDHRQP